MNASASRTGSDAEAAIASLAGRQHGVVTRRQLLAVGLSSDVVDRRLKVGRLRSLHRGVYQVGPVVAPRAAEMAAALACGPAAVLSHRSAQVLWELTRSSSRPEVEVMIRSGNRRRPGIRVRRVGTLAADEVTKIQGIPVTTPARTLFDLAESTVAGSFRLRELEQAVAEAFARRIVRPAQIMAVVTRHAGRPGTPVLRAIVQGGSPALARSEPEERFLALVRKARLHPPEANVRVAGLEVDFHWSQEGLVVEIDGFASHSSPAAFERDRRRDAILTAAGLRVVRVTWRQLADEPEAVLARLAQALVRQRKVT